MLQVVLTSVKLNRREWQETSRVQGLNEGNSEISPVSTKDSVVTSEVPVVRVSLAVLTISGAILVDVVE